VEEGSSLLEEPDSTPRMASTPKMKSTPRMKSIESTPRIESTSRMESIPRIITVKDQEMVQNNNTQISSFACSGQVVVVVVFVSF